MIGSLLTFFVVGLVTLMVAVIVLSILGTVLSLGLGLAGFLLFKVAPVLLVGWVILKLIDKGTGNSLSSADRRWLEEE
ncbi:MAG: hypothetical protein VYD78_03970 [Gemmatimonadota bacterium]|nr:hypothetical protein [Gemmatimonadota bacterium]